jgi:hypothetical protein
MGGLEQSAFFPRRVDNTDVWFATAIKGRQCAAGIPIAVPNSLLKESKIAWGETATVFGEVRFLYEVGLEDTAASVHHASPLIIFVDKIEGSAKKKRSRDSIILTPVVLFDSMSGDSHIVPEWGGDFGYTFVHCDGGSKEQLDVAAHWVERYATKHEGRIITNYDQLSPILSDAPLSYQRLVKKTYDRTIIENLHFNGAKLADRIDQIKQVHTEYTNYGQVGAMGDNASSDKNGLLQRIKSRFRKKKE